MYLKSKYFLNHIKWTKTLHYIFKYLQPKTEYIAVKYEEV